jgi:hypothetical protein
MDHRYGLGMCDSYLAHCYRPSRASYPYSDKSLGVAPATSRGIRTNPGNGDRPPPEGYRPSAPLLIQEGNFLTASGLATAAHIRKRILREQDK